MTAKTRLAESLRRAWLPTALVVGAFGAALAPVADGDLYWHLAAGREMAASHALLRTDPFSVSAAGRPWPDVHWLFQLGVYAVHLAIGVRGLVLAKCSLVALTAWVLYAAVERRARAVFVPAFLVAVFLCRHLLLVRPVIVTLLILALFFLQLERHRRTGRAQALVPLPFLQILWVNVQGLFALGPAVIFAFALGAYGTAAFGNRKYFPFALEGRSDARALARARPLLVVMLLTAIASLVTPFGMSAFTLPARLLGRITPSSENVFSANVAENVPPFTLEQTAPAEIWHFKWILALLAVGLLLAARRMVLSRALLLGGFVVLAAMGNRNVALLYFLSPAILAEGAAGAWRRAARAVRATRGRWLLAGASPLTVVAALSLVGVAAAREPSLREPAPFRFPSESASLLQRLPRGGTIFSADHQGGYLIWRLYPRFRPYMDTRLILRTADEYAEYLDVVDHPERFDAFQRRHGFAAIVLPIAYPDRYLGLVRHLYAGRDFKLSFTDGSEALFLRREGWADDGVNLGERATTDRLLALAESRFAGDARLLSAARIQIATLCVVVGELAAAARVLSGMPGPEAEALSGRVKLGAGDLDGAERSAGDALARDARDVRALDLLAAVSARRGELRRAAGFLRQALSVDPFDGEATNLLATMEAHQHER